MYTGITGALKINTKAVAVPIAYISGWSISDNTEMIGMTDMSRINKGALSGVQSWSASADGAVAFESISSQEELFKAKYSGQKVCMQFYLDNGDADDTSTYFEGEGYIESLSVDLSAEDKGNISISITGDGPLDLCINGKNIRTAAPAESRIVSMHINNSGHLLVNVPAGKEDMAYLDSNNHLILEL